MPLECLDGCFIRDSTDQDPLTVCVARVYPYRAIAAIPCDAKGDNPRATERIAAFVKDNDLEYYNADMHSAAFALPNYVHKLLGRI